MSIDLDVYSGIDPTHQLRQFALQHRASSIDDQFVLRGWRWQLTIDCAGEIEPEDVIQRVGRRLDGVRYLTEFHVEGAAPRGAICRAITIGRQLAVATEGYLFDPQSGKLESARGIETVAPAPTLVRDADVYLSWCLKTPRI